MEEEKEETLREKMERLDMKLKEMDEKNRKSAEKKFRIPFGKKVGKSQKRKNFITLVTMNENHGIDFKKINIENQTIKEDGIPRIATAEYVMYYKDNPFIFLPSFSNKPISIKDLQDKSIENGSNINGYKLLLSEMKRQQIDSKKKIGGAIKWIFGGVLAVIIIYALVTGGA